MTETKEFTPLERNLQLFTNKGIDYLYNLETKQENLFWAGNFGELNRDRESKEDADGAHFYVSTSGDGSRYMPDACFRIQGVEINLPTITFEENTLTHQSDFKSLNYNRQFNITWIEDVYRSISKYHMDWMLFGWYDRPNDCLKKGRKGKFRHLELCQWHWYNGQPTPIFVIYFDRIRPCGTGGTWKFGMGSKGEPTTTIPYTADSIQIIYCDYIDGVHINNSDSNPTSTDSSTDSIGNQTKVGSGDQTLPEASLLPEPEVQEDKYKGSEDLLIHYNREPKAPKMRPNAGSWDTHHLNSPDLVGFEGFTSMSKVPSAAGHSNSVSQSWIRLLRTLQIEDPKSEGFIS